MNRPKPVNGRATTPALLALLVLFPFVAHAEWRRTETTLAWRVNDKVVWEFSFDPQKGKPFFNPLSIGSGPSLTNFRPEDHPWHYGLWFSWKYINHVNYWEEDRQSGQSAGKTSWSPPTIETTPDGAATITLEVNYTNPATGQTDLFESRELRISAPAGGGYTIDWHANFTAGKERIELDRTPMPGEPRGAINGGYAGLSIRMANAPLGIEFLSSAGSVPAFRSDRSRPNVPAVAANFDQDGTSVGGIAILSDPLNAGEDAPWYLIHSTQMRFMCAAILAPKPRIVEAGGKFELNYRIALRSRAWTPESLHAGYASWRKAGR